MDFFGKILEAWEDFFCQLKANFFFFFLHIVIINYNY